MARPEVKMLKKFAIVGAALALAALSPPALAQEGVSVRFVPKTEQAINYSIIMNGLAVSGTSGSISGTMIERVKEVKPDGAYVLERLMTNAVFRAGENEVPIGDTLPSRTLYLANGEVSEAEGAENPEAEFRISALSVLVDPGKPVKVGDAWTHEFKSDKKKGARAARGEYKVLGEEKIGPFETVKIKAVVRETEGAEPAASDGTLWINKADGSLVQYDAKWTRAPFPGMGAHDVMVTMVRNDAKDKTEGGGG